MAANSQSSRGIARFGKRLVNQIWTVKNSTHHRPDPSHHHLSSSALRSTTTRGAHFSVYDKNVDDQARPSVVPDDVIQSDSDKYWGPHPKTGVFGPASSENGGPDGGDHSISTGNADSVLEQKAWFRPLEDIEKPQQN